MCVYIESEVFYMRINITLDEELVKKIDEVASKMYVSRSAYIAFAVSQKIQADKLMEYMPELTQSMKSMESFVNSMGSMNSNKNSNKNVDDISDNDFDADDDVKQ